MAAASTAERLPGVSLELGGKSCFIVFDDADVTAVVGAHDTNTLMTNRLQCLIVV